MYYEDAIYEPHLGLVRNLNTEDLADVVSHELNSGRGDDKSMGLRIVGRGLGKETSEVWSLPIDTALTVTVILPVKEQLSCGKLFGEGSHAGIDENCSARMGRRQDHRQQCLAGC